MIRILLADDSLLVRTVLADALKSAGDMTVVAEAGNGVEAVALTELHKPNIVIMDILMPVMGGLEATEAIMARSPVPILILSATVNEKDVNLAFTAIKKGALDVMGKPSLNTPENQQEFIDKLLEKIRLLSRIKVIRHIHSSKEQREVAALPQSGANRKILAIGASTGGPKAVMSIVKELPAGFGAAVFIVQHISSGFAKGFAQWLNMECSIPVRLAQEGDKVRSGEVLVAPTDRHLLIENGVVRLSDAPPVNCCRPSIDLFFSSLASGYAGQTAAVLLTGMGKDGAAGLADIKERGGRTIAQDEKTSVVFGMPKAAIALNAVDEILPLGDIPAALSRIFST
jgi:two-component system chemotaxis response regulator CheB